jgi:hypothetical protein
MGQETDSAAHRLAEVARYFRDNPVTGPAGHSYISSEPRPTRVFPPLPIDTSTGPYIQAAVDEVVQHTRSINPAAGPAPTRADAVYDWCRERTQHADDVQQQRRDTVIYRQYLEHAIRTRDFDVVRPHRCPSCNTFSLFYRQALGRVLCTNRRCLTDDGLSSTWTLARLAFEHIASRQKIRSIDAT